MALVYYSPVFRGYNATFLLAAALGARAIQFPVDNTGAALISFGIYELTLLLTAFFLFIAIQIRYRLHLWPNYETIEIPDRFLWIGGALTLFCALLYVIVGWPVYSRTGLDRYFIPAACLYVCAAQWTLGASILSRRHSLTLARQKETVRATFLRTLAIVALSLAALLYAGLTFPGPGLQRLTRARGASGELMLLTGMLLDRDADGNSLWPGADPDDADPCVRANIGALCDDAHRADEDPAITATGRNAVLLTWVNTERGARMPTATTGIPLYFATNRPVRSIRAMFQGTDGMGDYAGIRPGDFGFLPRLARAGYRTLCAGNDGGRGYFRAGSRSRLDAGCQVFQPLDPGITPASSSPEKASATPASSSHDINDTIRAGLRLLDRYGENSANFLWIHHAAASDETPPRSELLQRLQQKGELIVIQLYPDDVFGQAFIYTRQSSSPMVEYPEPGPLLAYALGFSKSPPPSAKDRVSVLYDQPFESSWWLRAVRRLGSGYPSFPVYTLRLDEAGQPIVFDGLTGSLTRPPRQSPQSRPL
jgi:hypothetical protein